MITSNLANPFLRVEGLSWNLNCHVAFYSHLTTQTLSLSRFFLIDVVLLSGQDLPTTVEHFYFALSAGTAAATSTTDKDTRVSQGAQQLPTCGNFNRLLLVDQNLDRTRSH